MRTGMQKAFRPLESQDRKKGGCRSAAVRPDWRGSGSVEQKEASGHCIQATLRQTRRAVDVYGIPNMKLEKSIVERKLKVMEEEGVTFVTGANNGKKM